MKERDRDWLLGSDQAPDYHHFADEIAWQDHKIRFAVQHCKGKDVLDLGCVQHNPENYQSRYWLHKALAKVANSIEGLDLYESGAHYLNERGYHVLVGDAESFSTGQKYDVIVAGDLIEHLEDLRGFLTSCKSHLRPGGVLLISTPNPWYWRNVAKAVLFGRVSTNQEHSMWMCPTVLGQLVQRHGLVIDSWHFGSRSLKDKILPLPRGIKHTSFHAVVKMASI